MSEAHFLFKLFPLAKKKKKKKGLDQGRNLPKGA